MIEPKLLSILALAAAFLPGAAFAQVALTGASPSADSVAQGIPTVVELNFSKPVETGGSHITVKDAKGKRVDGNDLHSIGSDRTHLAVTLKATLPGRYLVDWQAAAADAHSTGGSFSFTIAQ